MQFGIVSHYLSIDEQMVPYFGRHSIWSNSICLQELGALRTCRENNPQGGASGTRVVNSHCNVIENAENYKIYFVNQFTSIPLLEDMRRRQTKATWTLRSNRVQNCPITKCETIKKKERGFFEEHNCGDISIVRWNDNQVVTLASNHSTSSPTSTCSRYSRVQRSWMNVVQPHVIQKCNRYIGGLDQLDGLLINMRPAIDGRKWY